MISKSKDNDRKTRETAVASRFGSLLLLALLLSSMVIGNSQEKETPSKNFITQPLSLEDTVNLALEHNPSLLRARKEIEAAHGIKLQARAVALPKLRLSGAFNALQDSDVDRPPAGNLGFTFGTDKNWNTQIRVVQSVYEGGRMSSAFRVGK